MISQRREKQSGPRASRAKQITIFNAKRVRRELLRAGSGLVENIYFLVPYLRLGISGIITFLEVVSILMYTWSLTQEIPSCSNVGVHLIILVNQNIRFTQNFG